MNLYEKIQCKEVLIGIIGLGYVGLPLSVEKARAGFEVLGFDIQRSKVDMVNGGENYIGDVVSEELSRFVAEGRLSASTDFSRISECDVVTICVPTPLDGFKQPDLSHIVDTARTVAKYIHPEMLIILESTTYPGTTEEVLKPILESSGLKAGRDFYLVFSPERVDPGNEKYRPEITPKVVGGCTAQCTAHARALYESVLDAEVFAVSSPMEAEMSKILENTYRIVNCALANEMAIVCNRMGINVWEVIAAAATKPFGFVPFYPGPGVGGHCIPVDPFYLTYKARAFDYHTRLIELAGEINGAMPDYVVERMMNFFNDRGKTLKGSEILLLGVTYKGDVDDLRRSPALVVWERLESRGAIVSYSDPYCPIIEAKGRTVTSTTLTVKTLGAVDAVLITTAHRQKVDYGFVMENARLVLDTKNIVATILGPEARELDNLHLL